MDVLRLQLNADDFVVNKDRLPRLQKLMVAFSQGKTLLLLQQLQEAWQLVESAVAISLRRNIFDCGDGSCLLILTVT